MSSYIPILWVAADPVAAGGLDPTTIHIGCPVRVVREPEEALAWVRRCGALAVVVSCPLERWTAAQVLDEVQRADPRVPVLIHDPRGTPEDAFRFGGLGAFAFLSGPADAAALAPRLEAAVEAARSRQLEQLAGAAGGRGESRLLVGRSRAVRQVLEVIRLVAGRRCTVLITGETGTGKEVVARALHEASPRAGRPMVTVNCAALPEHLLEAELFGHVRGAFTGALHHRTGRFEQAHGGTLLLDEIGDMPLDLQVKLLRVLQEREFQRLGSSETVKVDIRVVAASNNDLVEKIRAGKFREDLFYRLNVVPIHMPPLRERPEDIPLLAEHFAAKHCRQEGLPHKRIHADAIERLLRHGWPGNVRELENAVEMAVVLSGDRDTLVPADFRLPTAVPPRPAHAAAPAIVVPDEGLDFDRTVGAFERNLLEQALQRSGGNKKRAADLLRLKRTTLSAKLRSLEVRTAALP